ncbi:aromatic ring-hydroxylating dioxygenase subunit alpha [Sphingobium sp.]|uniref:aromatic ring-hydroxylating oxygenase subunit alpha n=1 Tax=Sphingobium sp. TaxID=1912891 RepID=UPI0028BE5039|nr:aromatic ring-hydroxylating dioxygenase subunit alpha [Sphingobium sp.]
MGSETTFAPDYRQSHIPLYQQVIADDPAPAPRVLREYSETDVPVTSAPRAQYRDPAFAALEEERMWPRVWQFACREEQIPETGDCVVYESPGASFIIMRSADNEIRAFYNSCLHRGMKLCTHDTSVMKLACPFHGFTWNLDGTLAHVPARWDFPDLDEKKMRLPEARVECWQGFVFINRDAEAPPLLAYLGHLPAHFADWSYEDKYLATVIRKTVDANWKTAIEAFLESYHLAGIHAQALPFGGDASTQYDVWADDPHVSRFLEPTGVMSDQLPRALSEQEILNAALGVVFAGAEPPQLDEGSKARHYMAAGMRAAMSEADGIDYSGLSDTEAADAVQYSVFPNMIIFRALGYPYVYRFLPMRGDTNRATFEFLIFKPKPGEGQPVPEVNLVDLGEQNTFAGAGILPPWHGEIYDQDVNGLRQCQQGMRDGGDSNIIYSAYQEVRIRHLHQTLARYLSDDPKDAPGRR